MTSRDRQERQSDALDGLARTLTAVVLLGVVLAALPGLALGLAIAVALRAARLRWTFAALAAFMLALPRALRPTASVDAAAALGSDFAAGHPVDVSRVASALTPFWLLIAGLVGVLAKRWIDRRSRLHGGSAERQLKRELGPVALVTRRRKRKRALEVRVETDESVLGDVG